MAKKASSKKTAKKTTKKVVKKPAAKKTTKKKSVTKKTSKKTTKKAASKKAPVKKKAASKKAPAKKKTVSKKTAKKTSKKAPAKPVKKKTTKKAATKKTPAKNTPAKKTAKKTTPKAESKATPAAKTDGQDAKADLKSGRKGITIVNDKKPNRRSRPSNKAKLPPRPNMPSLLGPNSKFKGPLIPSGPKNTVDDGALDTGSSRKTKSPFTKRQLDKFREILVQKRAEVFGTLEELETEALRSGGSGGLSKLPQHHAEQGSDSADQSLSLNLAEADRVLIREIDAALERIADRTYGLCAMTNQPISEERLKELPWAQYSIEAARRMEQGRS